MYTRMLRRFQTKLTGEESGNQDTEPEERGFKRRFKKSRISFWPIL